MSPSRPSFTVRQANRQDIYNVVHIYVETWRNTYAGLLPDKVLTTMDESRQMMFWRRMVNRRFGSNLLLVAEAENGEIVGFTNCGPARPNYLAYFGEVYTLYVLSDYQNLGIGKALLTTAFERMVRRGANNAMVWVLADNPGRFFYEALGGKKVAEREELQWGVVLHEVAYGWDDLKETLSSLGTSDEPS